MIKTFACSSSQSKFITCKHSIKNSNLNHEFRYFFIKLHFVYTDLAMAQLIKAQSQVKPLFNGDGMLIGFEPRDQSIIPLRSRKIKFHGSSSTRLFASSSSVSSSESYKFKQPVNSDKSCYDIGYDLFYDDPEYVRDDLSCFRGLVLDISYRYFVIFSSSY